ncbi:MAG: hypothetical protein K9L62_10780 [Vallitaleaceae bacterium]|nr:hypothetical protein [Vallitaleaceae bacterium]
MKKNFVLSIILLLLMACASSQQPVVDVESVDNYFKTKHHNEIAILPTYDYLGMRSINIMDSIAVRDYHVWENQDDNKYILITVLTPKNGAFSKDMPWINRKNAIYSHGNVVAYNNVHERPLSVINDLGRFLPDCIIIAQEFYFHEKEVLYKALIVPDEICAEIPEPIVEELNYVANMQL